MKPFETPKGRESDRHLGGLYSNLGAKQPYIDAASNAGIRKSLIPASSRSGRPSIIPNFHARPSISAGRATNYNSRSMRQSIAPQSRGSLAPPMQPAASTAAVTPGMRSTDSGRRVSVAPWSIGGTNNANNVWPTSSNPPPSSVKDTRPLRDKSFQNHMIEEIQNYLQMSGFESTMRHSLTSRTVRSPTQKDFAAIFQFLYKKLDPGYRFTRAIDYEVYSILKTVQYPFIDNISKTQISAVGGSNWPAVLGMLYWLVELNVLMEKQDSDPISQEPSAGEATGLADQLELELIFFRYLSDSYRSFLVTGDRDRPEFREKMDQEYEACMAKYDDRVNELKQETDQMRQQVAALSERAREAETLKETGKVLEGDVTKFRAYIEAMKKRKNKNSSVLGKMEEQLRIQERRTLELQETRAQLQSKIADQGLSIPDIDDMSNQRENAARALDLLALKREDLELSTKEKLNRAQNSLEAIDDLLQRYNSAVFRVESSTSNMKGNRQSTKLEIKLRDNVLSLENLGKRPHELMIQDPEIKHALGLRRNDFASKLHKAHDENIRLQEAADKEAETSREMQEEIEKLESRLVAGKQRYSEIYETMVSDSSSSSANIEKLEREMQLIKMSTQQGLFQLNQRSQAVAIEHDQLVHEVDQERAKMVNKINGLVESIFNFKLQVQTTLEQYEQFVLEETRE